MTLKEAAEIVDKWITTVGKGYFQPVTNVAVLAEEVGELARIIVRRYGEQKPKPDDVIDDCALASEMADVLWVLLALSNQLGIDLTDAFANKCEKRSVRDAERF